MIPKYRPLSSGLVVMFEGIDGSGKTTQIELARDILEKAGWPVLSTRNLGGTPIGEQLREVILSPLPRPVQTDFYVSLAIQEALIEVVEAARQAGTIILMDRGPLSLAAYQIYGSGLPDELGWPHVADGMNKLHPESIMLYEMAAETALDRSRKHSPATLDYFENKPPDYFQRVAKGYSIVGAQFQVNSIDASQSIKNIHELTMQHIVAAIDQKIAESPSADIDGKHDHPIQ